MKSLSEKQCKCGHNHISYIGDKDGYNPSKKRIEECEKCNCEKFEEKWNVVFVTIMEQRLFIRASLVVLNVLKKEHIKED